MILTRERKLMMPSKKLTVNSSKIMFKLTVLGHQLLDAKLAKFLLISKSVMTLIKVRKLTTLSKKLTANSNRTMFKFTLLGHLLPDAKLDKSQPISRNVMISTRERKPTMLFKKPTVNLSRFNSLRRSLPPGHLLPGARMDKSLLISKPVMT